MSVLKGLGKSLFGLMWGPQRKVIFGGFGVKKWLSFVSYLGAR